MSKLPNPSTGPRTPEGKSRSSQNATRHGLAGRVVVLPSEDMSVYHRFSKEIVDDLNPQSALERELAQTIADGYWRLRRVRTTEDSLYALGHEEGQGDFDADHPSIHSSYTAAKTFREHHKAFATLSIYEQRIQRGIEKTTKQLHALQAERNARKEAERREALLLRDFNKMQNLPYDPRADQFVYSAAEIEQEASIRDRLEDALTAESVCFDYESYQKKAA